MTHGAYAVRPDEPLSAAHRCMEEHGIRHLPVLEDGRLVGIVSQRDLHLVETFGDVDPETIPVEEAMEPDVYAVPQGAALAQVCEQMVARKIGSAVVMHGDEVLGIFTTTDALRALAETIRAP